MAGDSSNSESGPVAGGMGQPESPRLWSFEGFDTMNTKPSRSAIGDQEMSWCLNFMPVGKNNLRTLYGKGPTVYTAPSGGTINYFAFFGLTTLAQDTANLPGHEYVVAFLGDGSATFTDLTNNSGVYTTASAMFPVSSAPGTAQWGNKYLIIVSQLISGNGYWLFDGANLYTSGTVGPVADIVGNGRGYTSVPSVTAYGGSGSGATFVATVTNGQVTSVAVTSPGSGYQVNEGIGLSFNGGGSSGSTAIITPSISNGQLIGTGIANAGAGYTSNATVNVAGDGSEAEVSLSVTGQMGSVTVTAGGAGYSGATATVTGANGSGSGATLTVTGVNGTISSIVVNTPGTGYQSPVVIAITGGGAGASATGTVVNGSVTSASVTNTGSGYTKATFTITDPDATVAQATLTLMPFGVQGTTVETYQSRVWIGDGDKGLFSSSGDPSNYSVADGAGVFRSTDSFLRQSYTKFLQSNGLLDIFGDSSINYISGVTTSGSPPNTTFTNQNIDPQIGTPWPTAAQVYSRAIVFANSFGVHALYGGAAQKVSGQLDGVLEQLPTTSYTPSAAVATIFGVHVYMILLPLQDPTTLTISNLLVMWDGKKWWAASQDFTPTYITTREINSNIVAYGTDGTNIYPMFSSPSASLTKIAQSKLWITPHYFVLKRELRMAMISKNNDSSPAVVSIALDNENASLAYTYGFTVPPTGPNQNWQVQAVENSGIMVGYTVNTTAKDFVLIALGCTGQDFISYV